MSAIGPGGAGSGVERPFVDLATRYRAAEEMRDMDRPLSPALRHIALQLLTECFPRWTVPVMLVEADGLPMPDGSHGWPTGSPTEPMIGRLASSDHQADVEEEVFDFGAGHAGVLTAILQAARQRHPSMYEGFMLQCTCDSSRPANDDEELLRHCLADKLEGEGPDELPPSVLGALGESAGRIELARSNTDQGPAHPSKRLRMADAADAGTMSASALPTPVPSSRQGPTQAVQAPTTRARYPEELGSTVKWALDWCEFGDRVANQYFEEFAKSVGLPHAKSISQYVDTYRNLTERGKRAVAYAWHRHCAANPERSEGGMEQFCGRFKLKPTDIHAWVDEHGVLARKDDKAMTYWQNRRLSGP